LLFKSIYETNKGARVILTCQDSAKAINVCQQIRLDSKNNHIEIEYMDLSSLKSTREFCRRIRKKIDKLDILVNNSGKLETYYKVLVH